MDGVFRLGMVNQHRHLLKPGDQCIGGGYYRFDYISNQMASAGSIEGPLNLSWLAYHL